MKRLLPLAFLAGCTTVGPDYERPQVELPKEYPAAASVTQVSLAQWWKLYRDPALDALVEATRRSNAELRFAAARVRESEAVLREASAAFFPEVLGGYSATRSRVSTRTSPPPAATAPRERSQHQLIASTSFESG